MTVEGNIPRKSEAQRAALRKRAAVRRHGMSYRPKVAKKGNRDKS